MKKREGGKQVVKAIIIGEVINDVKLLKRGENNLFLSLLIAEKNEKVRVYANNDVAVYIADNIKKGMIVYVECQLRYAKYTKWQDNFNLVVINIIDLWAKKPQFVDSKGKNSGLNGKHLPF